MPDGTQDGGNDVQVDSDRYESWVRTYCAVDGEALKRKRKRMARSPFAFLRASVYRWFGTVETLDGAVADAPRCLCVGDAHLENFGTWRDADGRPVWGVNDFDEAARLPFTTDLLRLAVSARLASDDEPGHFPIPPGAIAAAILDGYSAGLAGGPKPFLLDEPENAWLARICKPARDSFWKGLANDIDTGQPPPAEVMELLREALGPGADIVRAGRREAGLGSRERPR
jgi:hypothetical protein